MRGRDALVIGIGCTRGTPAEVLAAGIDQVLARHALAASDVRALASIDGKRDEPGLLALSSARGWPLALYAAEALAALSAQGHESGHALRAVGTPAVAEPAARLYAERGPLLVPKTTFTPARGGFHVTIAVARCMRAGSRV
jgi:cobalamin biosynthesis protein CbiG